MDSEFYVEDLKEFWDLVDKIVNFIRSIPSEKLEKYVRDFARKFGIDVKKRNLADDIKNSLVLSVLMLACVRELTNKRPSIVSLFYAIHTLSVVSGALSDFALSAIRYCAEKARSVEDVDIAMSYLTAIAEAIVSLKEATRKIAGLIIPVKSDQDTDSTMFV